MLSIYSKLFNLKLKNTEYPKEDFLTEVFAYCLNSDREILNSFISKFVEKVNINSFSVKTQKRFKKILNHDNDSIPDIAIECDDYSIFIECKIDAKQGINQLERYAEHLNTLSPKNKKVLIYLTRDFEEIDSCGISLRCNNLMFVSLRWYQIFEFFFKYSKNELIFEMLRLMKELNIASESQFTATDLLTISNIRSVLEKLERCMWKNDVSNTFEKKIGKLARTTVETRLRYGKYHYEYKNNGMYVMYGFKLVGNETPFPTIYFDVAFEYKNISAANRNIIKENIKKFNNDFNEWHSYNINNEEDWFGISKEKSITTFLNSENHFKEIEEQFIAWIEDYCKIKELITL